MVSVPGFLLRRLYVKQSLRNTSDGFEFELRNRLGSGYAHKLWPLTVDGDEVPIDQASFLLDGDETAFGDVSRGSTFALTMNKTIIVRVKGTSLQPGARKVGMGFDVPGLGTLKFDFRDLVEDG